MTEWEKKTLTKRQPNMASLSFVLVRGLWPPVFVWYIQALTGCVCPSLTHSHDICGKWPVCTQVDALHTQLGRAWGQKKPKPQTSRVSAPPHWVTLFCFWVRHRNLAFKEWRRFAWFHKALKGRFLLSSHNATKLKTNKIKQIKQQAWTQTLTEAGDWKELKGLQGFLKVLLRQTPPTQVSHL